jgi:hypothetical protein
VFCKPSRYTATVSTRALLQVQPGDYVSRVAEKLELRVEELLLLNADRIPQLGTYFPTGQQLLVCGIMSGEVQCIHFGCLLLTQQCRTPLSLFIVETVAYA